MIEVNSLTVRTADTTRRPRETVEADLAMIEVNSLTVQKKRILLEDLFEVLLVAIGSP